MRNVNKFRGTLILGLMLLLVMALWGIRDYFQEDRVFPKLQASAIQMGSTLEASAAKTQTIPAYVQWLRSEQAQALQGLLTLETLETLETSETSETPGTPGTSELTIRAAEYSAASADAQIVLRSDEQQGEVIDWTDAGGWLEWTVDAPQDGLYTLAVAYRPLKGSFANVVRGLQIDGSYPYQEAERITLERLWKDSQYPYERNGLGNEIRPVQIELSEWRTVLVTNYAASSEPLLWPLTKGRHTIRLMGGREPLSLASLTLAAPQPIPVYAEYVAAGGKDRESDSKAGEVAGADSNAVTGVETEDDAGLETKAEMNAETNAETKAVASAKASPQSGTGWFAIMEAEQYRAKSAIGIQTQSVAEPYLSPDPKGRLVYNAIGGDRWQQAGDWIEWEFTVPASGWYVIDMKVMQGYNGKAAAYRTVMLDGQVPFRELLHYALPASSDMEIRSLNDETGKPYQFWLEAGVHQLRLIADSSLISPAAESLRDVLTDLSVMERDIRLISGNYGSGSSSNLDTGRTWQVKTYDPQIETKLSGVIERLRTVRDYVDGLNQHVTDPTTAISSAMNSLEKMLEDVNEIPNQVKVFADIQTSINTWMKPMESQAVLLDYLVVREPQADPGLKLPHAWDKISYSTLNFARTFFQKYDLKDLNDEEAITVWVQRGRDYVDLLQKMIEADFTPQTGIRVNVNLMPSTNVLMLGNAAGDQPDIALGLGMETPVDYAMRGAAAELSQLAGFKDVVQRFNPGVMRSYAYDEGVYGLPETQSFMVMFYRTDVLERLGLTPPDTWDDVLNLLPTLQENGMDMYYPAKEFVMPFYQQGAEFYTADGMQTAIDSKTAQAAFQRWTDLFSTYNVPKEVPAFFNHFRSGDIPIGMADYNTYIQLSVAAPEITGKWKMAPLPGLRGEDGQVVRWSQQSTTAAMLMEKSKNKEQAWMFLDWWTSTDTQAQYANDIESFAGIEYRWNPANIEALQYVPWPSEDMQVLAEQGRWGKNMPYVPGYYFLAREMDFAWNNTVLSGMPPKEAIRKAAVSLQREMTRKQKEFGFGPGMNLHLPGYEGEVGVSIGEGGDEGAK
ncbi:extracellular solute-binding protein [Paenibacillus eucommiae]|uniref:ABC-type glycerol-3-phosphate transport system substrate-binding protein n=1 Tax=Paenibacillus eucommiae TaxID=1355755 RepID=A0ABS4ITU4_9BACL|nr:extracellular solute-binding protein [Paenibacillus eucommiae]MBP1990963.1 ABC-type glycerol-3-phosphate transport system substrate-binding protein [Paenibacillus eucommiae]